MHLESIKEHNNKFIINQIIIIMKKLVLVLIAAFAFSIGAYAQRESVPYVGIGVATNFRSAEEGRTGPALAIGLRNYNRDSFLSFTYGAEAFGYYIPSKTQQSTFGIFANPEIGLAIGPSIFKVFLHTGFMLGYDNATNIDGEKRGLGWGGKDGLAFDIGRFVTVDFSTYVPRYNFNEALYAASLIVRFGR